MSKRKRRAPTTITGILNRHIDQTFHHHFQTDKTSIVIDTALHFLVEQNPKQSIKKFFRYSLKHVIG